MAKLIRIASVVNFQEYIDYGDNAPEVVVYQVVGVSEDTPFLVYDETEGPPKILAKFREEKDAQKYAREVIDSRAQEPG